MSLKDYNQAVNDTNAIRKRLLKYVGPSFLTALAFNIVKFFEAKVTDMFIRFFLSSFSIILKAGKFQLRNIFLKINYGILGFLFGPRAKKTGVYLSINDKKKNYLLHKTLGDDYHVKFPFP